jgi:hypothetical protein
MLNKRSIEVFYRIILSLHNRVTWLFTFDLSRLLLVFLKIYSMYPSSMFIYSIQVSYWYHVRSMLLVSIVRYLLEHDWIFSMIVCHLLSYSRHRYSFVHLKRMTWKVLYCFSYTSMISSWLNWCNSSKTTLFIIRSCLSTINRIAYQSSMFKRQTDRFPCSACSWWQWIQLEFHFIPCIHRTQVPRVSNDRVQQMDSYVRVIHSVYYRLESRTSVFNIVYIHKTVHHENLACYIKIFERWNSRPIADIDHCYCWSFYQWWYIQISFNSSFSWDIRLIHDIVIVKYNGTIKTNINISSQLLLYELLIEFYFQIRRKTRQMSVCVCVCVYESTWTRILLTWP